MGTGSIVSTARLQENALESLSSIKETKLIKPQESFILKKKPNLWTAHNVHKVSIEHQGNCVSMWLQRKCVSKWPRSKCAWMWPRSKCLSLWYQWKWVDFRKGVFHAELATKVISGQNGGPRKHVPHEEKEQRAWDLNSWFSWSWWQVTAVPPDRLRHWTQQLR